MFKIDFVMRFISTMMACTKNAHAMYTMLEWFCLEKEFQFYPRQKMAGISPTTRHIFNPPSIISPRISYLQFSSPYFPYLDST
ncbi:hypothetical protein HanIR_Chr17g0865351 [Helianthus annuus]|nr:hypothetical protein HanIR_Chr17g0865351 [Helianthus annuus]